MLSHHRNSILRQFLPDELRKELIRQRDETEEKVEKS